MELTDEQWNISALPRMGKAGTFETVLRRLVEDVKERGDLNLTECFIDGTFVIAKKGAQVWEKPSGAKVQSSWQWQMALVFLSPYPLEVLHRKVPFRV